MKYALLLLILVATHIHAAEWVVLYEDAEQVMEYDKSSIKPYEGEKFVRERVTFKKAVAQDDGVKVKYMLMGALFSCRNKTETVKVVRKHSEDNRVVATKEMNSMVMRAKPGSVSAIIINQICTKAELESP